MIQSIKKRTLFFLSILVTGLVGIVGSYVRTNYSKNDSPLISTAHADLREYTWDVGACDGGCACGGCSGAGGDSGAG